MKFIFNGQTITDSTAISNLFNDFFVNVGPNLAKKIAPTNKEPNSFIKKDYTISMYVKKTEEGEVRKIISGLKDGAPGWDNIPAKLLKSNVIA